MAVATWQQVQTALGRPISTEAEQEQVTWWLTGIEMLIRSRLGDLTLIDQDTLVYVEVEAAAEKARRHGTRESSITVTADDGSVTRRYENQVSDGDITDYWWNLLSPASASAAFTINPIRRRGCRP